METLYTREEKLRNAAALRRLGIFLSSFLFMAAILTSKSYLCFPQSEATVTGFVIPIIEESIFSSDGYHYRYDYKCEFIDYDGRERIGIFRCSESDLNRSEYYKNNKITIYYRPEYTYGDLVYTNIPTQLNDIQIWLIIIFCFLELYLVTTYIQKRILYENLYGRL